jgi:threonine dehydrogenase-like Zn-dependent dehydrogenase
MASLLKFLALGCSVTSALAATCTVAGGTSDDGPAIKAALATCNNGGTVVLAGTYTLATVLNTTALNNVAIELTGKIVLSPGRGGHDLTFI